MLNIKFGELVNTGLWVNKFYGDIDSVVISISDTVGKRMKGISQRLSENETP